MFETSKFHRYRKGNFGSSFYYFENVDSTNSIATKIAKSNCPEGTVILSESQSKGKGRKNSAWFSPPDVNLYSSIILYPQTATLRYLPFLPALALLRALSRLKVQSDLKWPNDVLIASKKVSGILIETVFEENILKFGVVGTGINVNSASWPDELSAIATSIQEHTGFKVCRESLLADYLFEFEDLYEKIGSMDWSDFTSELEKNSTYLRGCHVRILQTNDETEGITEGLDETGGLVLRTKDGLRVFYAGEIQSCRKK